MKKRTLLLTTLAGTMIVAGMSETGVKAAIGEKASAIIREKDTSAYVQLASAEDNLTRADLEKLVNARYENAKVDTRVSTIAGEEVTNENGTKAVGTGAKVVLSNKKELTLVVYGDTTGDGKVNQRDANLILTGNYENDYQKKAADVVTTTGDQRDANKILNYYAEGSKFEGKLVDEELEVKEEDEDIESSIKTVSFIDDKFGNNQNDIKTDENGKISEATLTSLQNKVKDESGEYRLLGWTKTQGSRDLVDFKTETIKEDRNFYSVWVLDVETVVTIHFDGTKQEGTTVTKTLSNYKAGDTINFNEDKNFALTATYESTKDQNGSVVYSQKGWYADDITGAAGAVLTEKSKSTKTTFTIPVPTEEELAKAKEEAAKKEEEFVLKVDLHPSWNIDVTSYSDLNATGINAIITELTSLQNDNDSNNADITIDAKVTVDSDIGIGSSSTSIPDGVTITFDGNVTVNDDKYLPKPTRDAKGVITKQQVIKGEDAIITKLVKDNGTNVGLNDSLNNELYDVVKMNQANANISGAVTVEKDSVAVLDINGNKTDLGGVVVNKGDLTIKNGSKSTSKELQVPNGLINNGNLTIGSESKEEGTVLLKNYSSSTSTTVTNRKDAELKKDAKLTLISGSISTGAKSGANAVAAVSNEKGAILEVKGGAIDASDENYKIPAILNEGIATISDGSILRSGNKSDSNTDGFEVVVNHGELTISGGTFKAGSTATATARLIENGYDTISNAFDEDGKIKEVKLTVTGGTFEGGLYAIENDYAGVANITGGEYKAIATTQTFGTTVVANKTRSIFKTVGEMTIDFSKSTPIVTDSQGKKTGDTEIDLGSESSETKLVVVGDEQLKLTDVQYNSVAKNSVKIYSFDHSLVKKEDALTEEDDLSKLIDVETASNSSSAHTPSDISVYISGEDAEDAGNRLVNVMKTITTMSNINNIDNKVRIVLCSDVEITSDTENSSLLSDYNVNKGKTILNLNGHTLKINKLALFENNVTVEDEKEEGAGSGNGRIILKGDKTGNVEVDIFKEGKLLSEKELRDMLDVKVTAK